MPNAMWERSRTLFERSKLSLAGGVSSNVRMYSPPHPFFYNRAQGTRLWDVDGNEYVDYVLGQGPMVLGHSHPRVLTAVQEALMEGQLYAGQHEREILLSEKLQEIIPCAGLVRYSNSGSEAVHTTLRLARAYTGRIKILKFEGQYHGWFDNILYSLAPSLDQAGPRHSPHLVPGSRGQPTSAEQDMIVLPWNDLALFRSTLADHGDEIACVIMEPIMCNTSVILPKAGFLEGVRQECSARGVLLIFDEIITGFRIGLGGAQSYFGVIPDIAVFGKAMAAGFPISCIAGRHEIMEQIARGEVNHAGTFNTNVICMAAALATIAELEQDNGAIYRAMHEAGEQLMQGIMELAEARSIPIHVQGLGAIFHMAFTAQAGLFEYRDYLQCDTKRYQQLVVALAERGVNVVPRGTWYLSAAHSEEEIAMTLERLDSALSSVATVLESTH
jgi:glutamate-1-semialdehyde 2,1-aminomutase